jgi:NitT/TauT family transport system permease protein
METTEGAPVVKPVGGHAGAAFHVGSLVRKEGWIGAFLPNRTVSRGTMRLIVLVEALAFLIVWIRSPFAILPRPDEVLQALRHLWLKEGLGPELITSFTLNLQALGWSTLITLLLSYSTVIPVMRPIVSAIARGRFLSLAGFSLLFMVITGGGHELKVWMLVFGITVFYVTSMASIVAAIPKSDFDYARTLRMKEWRVVWEVVVLGTADKAFEVLRQNAAIGWMMLTMVEGIVRSEGGIGGMLLSEQKYFRLADVFAIQLVVLVVGLSQDYVIGLIRRLACPYADIVLERK